MAESKGCSVVVVALVTALAFVVGAAAGAGAMWFTNPVPADVPAPVVTAPTAGDTKLAQGQTYAAAFPLPETLRVEGPLSEEVVREVVLGRRAELRECYQAGIDRDPSLKGEISLQFTIAGSNGAVTAAVQRYTKFADPLVTECILGKVKTWKFPKAASASVVKFDLLLIAITGNDPLR